MSSQQSSILNESSIYSSPLSMSGIGGGSESAQLTSFAPITSEKDLQDLVSASLANSTHPMSSTPTSSKSTISMRSAVKRSRSNHAVVSGSQFLPSQHKTTATKDITLNDSYSPVHLPSVVTRKTLSSDSPFIGRSYIEDSVDPSAISSAKQIYYTARLGRYGREVSVGRTRASEAGDYRLSRTDRDGSQAPAFNSNIENRDTRRVEEVSRRRKEHRRSISRSVHEESSRLYTHTDRSVRAPSEHRASYRNMPSHRSRRNPFIKTSVESRREIPSPSVTPIWQTLWLAFASISLGLGFFGMLRGMYNEAMSNDGVISAPNVKLYLQACLVMFVGVSLFGAAALTYMKLLESRQHREEETRQMYRKVMEILELRGSAVVVHLRDELCERTDDPLWPEVVRRVQLDSRVRGQRKHVGGLEQKEWAWMAVQRKTDVTLPLHTISATTQDSQLDLSLGPVTPLWSVAGNGANARVIAPDITADEPEEAPISVLPKGDNVRSSSDPNDLVDHENPAEEEDDDMANTTLLC
eukprot:CFRG2984T1